MRLKFRPADVTVLGVGQCQAINVGFELYIGIESKLSISIISFDLGLGDFVMNFIQYQYQ